MYPKGVFSLIKPKKNDSYATSLIVSLTKSLQICVLNQPLLYYMMIPSKSN